MNTSSPPLQAALLQNPLLNGQTLGDEERTILTSVGFVGRSYPAHSPIRLSGEGAHRIFLFHSGWCCLYRDLREGERQILDFPLSGDIVELGSSRAETHAELITITDAALFEAPAQKVISAFSTSRRLASILFQAKTREEAIAAEHLLNLGRRRASVRTAHLILELYERLEASGHANGGRFECPLTQHELADALGLTPIHVNRMLRELREEGLLSFRQGMVEFLDKEKTIEFADFDNHYLSRRT